ncbi:hypothetical protein NFI96_029761, partial [Prochilodus magdalenae]
FNHSQTHTGTDNNQTKITSFYSPLKTPYTSNKTIQDLPPSLLEEVFSYLPSEQLCLHVKNVCFSWREIISNPQFLPWRKLYYGYQQGESGAERKVQRYLSENDITRENEQCVISLVRFLSLKFPAYMGPQSHQISQCMKGHRLYRQAQDCLRTYPTLLNTNNCCWVALVVLMVLLADGVEDVEALVFRLQSSSCPLSHIALSEVLWALSTLLLAMKHASIRVSSRVHYNLFYVLYQMENTAPPVDGSRSVCVTREKQLQMTQEQQCAINHNMQPNHVVKVVAFAGTGKTSMLVRFSQQRPALRLLYVTFNKPIVNAAKRQFPKNVDCRTIHSLAWEAVGKRFSRREFVKIAKDVWSKMIKKEPPGNDSYPITPDGYLKLWQLERPSLKQYDIIMIDEAQDCSPVCVYVLIMDILLSQPCAKILVGDPHQQIYSFRGAVNALHTVSHTHLYYLTQAVCAVMTVKWWTVCRVSGVCEGRCKNRCVCLSNHRLFLVFSKSVCLGVQKSELEDILDIWTLKSGEQYMTEFQNPFFKNFSSYEAFRHYVTESEDKELSYKLNTVEKFNMEIPHLVCSIIARTARNSQKAGKYMHTSGCTPGPATWTTGPQATFSLPSLVQVYNSVSGVLRQLFRLHHSGVWSYFILGTVHKSKGLEFHTVIIADDFVRVPRPASPLQVTLPTDVPEDEWNLLYMAVTRAKARLFLNKTIIGILEMKGHCFLESGITVVGPTFECCAPDSRACGMKNGAAMRKRPVTYVSSLLRSGLTACPGCFLSAGIDWSLQQLLPIRADEGFPVPVCWIAVKSGSTKGRFGHSYRVVTIEMLSTCPEQTRQKLFEHKLLCVQRWSERENGVGGEKERRERGVKTAPGGPTAFNNLVLNFAPEERGTVRPG